MSDQVTKPEPTKGAKIVAGVIVGSVLLFIVAAVSGGDSSTPTTNSATPAESSQVAAAEPVKEQQPEVPAEYRSALTQANTYATSMNLSKQGVYDQLVSEYGGKFTPEAAQYAIDNVKADWNANALAQAKTYQNDMSLSPAAVRDQLVSEYGGQFTEAEADYAIANLNN